MPGTLQIFIDGPPNLIPMVGPHPEPVAKGRYQYNSMTDRFEWMGYE
jgi:hypothetical protein